MGKKNSLAKIAAGQIAPPRQRLRNVPDSWVPDEEPGARQAFSRQRIGGRTDESGAYSVPPGYIEFLREQGVSEDTLQRIASGELPMDPASRMARAKEMGYDTDTTFRRIDQPGITEFSDDPQYRGGTLYASTSYENARKGNVTGGNAEYPLMFQEGILGLHPSGSGMDESMIQEAMSDSMDAYADTPAVDSLPFDAPQNLARAMSGLEEVSPDALRRSLLQANEESATSPVRDHLVMYSDMPSEDYSRGTPLAQHLRRSLLSVGDDMDMADAEDVSAALHALNMETGMERVVADMGYTGSLAADETGASVATFLPKQVRHKYLSALDPMAKGSPNIFQSLLAPVGVAGAAAAAGIGQEER